MENKSWLVIGTQSCNHKLLITSLRKEHSADPDSALFQLFNEDTIISVKMPLEPLARALASAAPGAPHCSPGFSTLDYFIASVARGDEGGVSLTAVRGGTRALTVKFALEQVRVAVNSALLDAKYRC